MKARAHFEKAANTPIDIDGAGCRFSNPRKNLQQGRLACAVAADNANNFAALYLEGNVAKSPNVVRLRIGACELRIFRTRGRMAVAVAIEALERSGEGFGERLAECTVPRSRST